jgi:hypothetical protein
MRSRFNRATHPSRNIRCAVVEVHPMRDLGDRNQYDGFWDLVPWADPYIAALVEKLRRSAEELDQRAQPVNELEPPLDSHDSDRGEGWPSDWAPRNSPRE